MEVADLQKTSSKDDIGGNGLSGGIALLNATAYAASAPRKIRRVARPRW
jgi:hypothetical protein